MFSRLLILSLISTNSAFAVIGEESALLSSILSEQVQAVAGISQIIRDGQEQLESVKKLQEAHESLENSRMKVERAVYYTQMLGRFGGENERIKSFVEIRNNLQNAKDLADRRHDLTLGQEVLVFSSNHANESAKKGVENKSFHKRELINMRNQLALAKTTGTSSKVAAAGAVFTSAQLMELNENLSKLIAYQGTTQLAMALEQERRNYNEFIIKKRWGIVPDISYDEYKKLILKNRKKGRSNGLQ